jgi:hypothetical protein
MTTKSKSPTASIIAISLIILLIISFCYLTYKTWNIFGFWTIVITGIISAVSSTLLGNLVGSRSEKDGVIIYNPKELPKFLNIIVSLSIGYYLYTILNSKILTNYDYMFGMAYLVLLTFTPLVFSLFKLIRDRNDYISISSTTISYKDNKEGETFQISDIKNVELSLGIKLTFKDDTTCLIKPNQMNFNGKDLLNAFNDIKDKLPKTETVEAENTVE